MKWIQTLLELPNDILVEIIKKIPINCRLINIAFVGICNQYKLSNKTNIFEKTSPNAV